MRACFVRPRYQGLDTLRAVVMLLGLWIHGVLIVTEYARPIAHAPLLERSAVFVHAFRMPVFFVLAGFFASLLVDRRGWWVFAKNRAMRIAVPLGVGVLTIVPVMAALWPGEATGFLAWWPSLYHLWFLQYLVLMYLGAAVAVPVAKSLGAARLTPLAGRLVGSRFRGLWLGLLATGFMLAVPGLNPGGGGPGLWPDLGVFVYSSGFFALGWVLYACRDRVNGLCLGDTGPADARWIGALALGGFVAFPLALRFVHREHDLDAAGMLLGKLCYSMVTGLVVWGLIGGFLAMGRAMERPGRAATRARAVVRYFSDASYWVYLVHLPVLVVVAGPIARLPLPPEAKLALLLLLTAPVLLASYHWLVRPTVIGRVLNGFGGARSACRERCSAPEPTTLTVDAAGRPVP